MKLYWFWPIHNLPHVVLFAAVVWKFLSFFTLFLNARKIKVLKNPWSIHFMYVLLLSRRQQFWQQTFFLRANEMLKAYNLNTQNVSLSEIKHELWNVCYSCSHHIHTSLSISRSIRMYLTRYVSVYIYTVSLVLLSNNCMFSMPHYR